MTVLKLFALGFRTFAVNTNVSGEAALKRSGVFDETHSPAMIT